MSGDATSDETVRELLSDSFDRIRELVESVTDGLTLDVSTYRPDLEANSICWLVWHLTRVQDDHMAALAGVDQVWTSSGWHDRFGLPFEEGETGYAQSSAAVSEVRVDADLLDRYHDEVHQRCLAYVEGLTAGDLERVVDDRWDPPVTAGVRIVSVLGDCLQHIGQAAYLLPIARRAVSGSPRNG